MTLQQGQKVVESSLEAYGQDNSKTLIIKKKIKYLGVWAEFTYLSFGTQMPKYGYSAPDPQIFEFLKKYIEISELCYQYASNELSTTF